MRLDEAVAYVRSELALLNYFPAASVALIESGLEILEDLMGAPQLYINTYNSDTLTCNVSQPLYTLSGQTYVSVNDATDMTSDFSANATLSAVTYSLGTAVKIVAQFSAPVADATAMIYSSNALYSRSGDSYVPVAATFTNNAWIIG